MTAPVSGQGSGLAGGPLRARDLLAALVVVILWGVNFVAMKWGLRSFSPFQLDRKSVV